MSWMRHKRLVDDCNEQTAAAENYSRRDITTSKQQQHRIRRDEATRSLLSPTRGSNRHLHSPTSQLEEEDDDDEERLGWRRAAQMLTDDDEQQFLYQQQQQQRPNSRQQQQQDDLEDEDDNSSISFAQSGCHSILSAWRLKQRRQQQQQQKRPTSVLSNASSAGKKSAASTALTGFRSTASKFGALPQSTAQSRIALGPRGAQYLVTNSRRRRRANELIMNTLEARRRAIAMNRQNGGSLLGGASPSYLLADYHQDDLHSAPGVGGSLSPSPQQQFQHQQHMVMSQQQQQSQRRTRSPSPATNNYHQPARHALSDLGPTSQRRAHLGSAAAQAQRERALRAAAAVVNKRRPPLAKLDQNSSDLYTSNSSADSRSSTSSSYGGEDNNTRFAQLVTSELAPDCILLEAGQLSAERGRPSPAAASSSVLSTADDEAGRLRRGALKRDSIRRLRLNRQQKEPPPSSSSLSSADQQPAASSADQLAKRGRGQQQPLQLNRKSEIENNPFLNRHHFRSVSARQSPASDPAPAPAPVRDRQLAGDESSPSQRAAAAKQQQQRNSWLFSSARSRNEQLEQPEQQRRRLMMMASSSGGGGGDDNNREQAINVGGGGGKKVADGLISNGRQSAAAAAAAARQTTGSRKVMNKQAPASSPIREHRPMIATSESSRKNATREQQPQQQQQQAAKLVREGARSSDDLKFDAMGNRRQYELSEKWRYEREEEPPRAGKAQLIFDEKQRKLERLSQERFSSQRIEVLRSSSISPPVGFADRRPPPITSPKPTARDRAAARPRAISEERPAANPRTRPAETARPQVVPRRLLKQQQQQQQPKPAEQVPKFEESADDEFRKRVDYLRKLARSNLAAGDFEATQRQTSAKPLTRPMSTNWQPPGATQQIRQEESKPILDRKSTASLFDDRAKWNLGPLAESSRRSSPLTSTSTNLDSSLVDKKPHQLQWRRSNSSLASVGQQQQQPISQHRLPGLRYPQQQQQLRTSQSNLSTLSNSSGHPEVMKLVVREKSAPKLNYAFVEKSAQPPAAATQVPKPSPAPVVAPVAAPPRAQPRLPAQPQLRTQQVINQQQTSTTTTMRSSQHETSSQVIARSRSPLARSPRSPEFGPQAASSNDDSAIASSVSSPSLSYMLQANNQAAQAPAAPVDVSKPPPRPPPPTRPFNLQQQQQQPATEPHITAPAAGSQVTLQSILRRQQQQQQQYEQPPEPTFQEQQEARLRKFEQDCAAAAAAAAASEAYPPTTSQGFGTERDTSPQRSGTRRVTFNDRTSIRSFESISSLASNSTAVPANEMLRASLLRQQIGSPDSMGSGSTSRLSGESPDPRRGQPTQGGGAAIYAIRGDPELDPGSSAETSPMPQGPPQHGQPLMQQAHYMVQPPARQSPMVLAPVTSNYALPPAGLARPMQMQVQQPYLRMTAPPSINMHHQQQPQPQPQQQQQRRQPIQYLVRPTSSMSTQISPIQPPRQQQVYQPDEEPEEPDYALRLRQAATSRVFASYVQPQTNIHQQQQQQQQPLPPTLMRPQQQQQQQQRSQPTIDELLSYQTEV